MVAASQCCLSPRLWLDSYEPISKLLLGGASPACSYELATKYAEDIADLLAPQSGAYYDVWLDGEKFYAHEFEVRGQGGGWGGAGCWAAVGRRGW